MFKTEWPYITCPHAHALSHKLWVAHRDKEIYLHEGKSCWVEYLGHNKDTANYKLTEVRTDHNYKHEPKGISITCMHSSVLEQDLRSAWLNDSVYLHEGKPYWVQRGSESAFDITYRLIDVRPLKQLTVPVDAPADTPLPLSPVQRALLQPQQRRRTGLVGPDWW